VISAITTFFEVFYTNQSFNRYKKLYEEIRKMLGALCDFCFELRLYISDVSHQHTRLASRYFLASVILFVYEMNGEVSEKQWGELQRQGLVMPQERSYLEKFHKRQRSLLMLHWAAKVTHEGHTLTKGTKTPNNVLKAMISKLVSVRMLQQGIVDSLSLPMPFQYFHLLNLMIVVNLLLWAYAMGITDSFFAPVVYFFCSLIFMGMMELANQLSDPFGDDDVDFPLNDWISEFIETCVSVLEYKYPGEENCWKAALKLEKPLEGGERNVNILMDSQTTARSEDGCFGCCGPSSSAHTQLMESA
jgi:predicted membrane chloride channel (bestrophin family)